MSPTITPTRSREQRLVALRHANEVRLARARLKRAIKHGDVQLAILLVCDPTPVVEAMPVRDLLLAVPRLGPVKVDHVLRQARASSRKTLGGLSHRQRAEISDALETRRS